MKVMIVCACEEVREQLVRSIPVSQVDEVIEASGMLSALWYAKVHRPELIVIDLLAPDCCGMQLTDLLKRLCPEARLWLTTETAVSNVSRSLQAIESYRFL